MPAGNTFEAIATQTLGSAAASVTFSSIPSTYTDLVLVCSLIGSTDGQMRLLFNNDTGSNYSDTILAGNGTVAVSGRDSNQNNGIATDYYFSYTTDGGTTLINVMNYANTTTYKTALIRSGVGSKGTMAVVGLWRSTSAINRIDLNALFANFATGSTISLYGIKAA